MKAVRIIPVVIFLFFATSMVALGHGRDATVGAPLDGGLLAILGAAGIAYFAARKKKKNE
jgi:hypothetical protein